MTETKQLMTVVLPAVDRRAQHRMKTSQPVVAHILPTGQYWEACILDISAGGAHLRSSAAIAPGTHVRLEAEGLLLAGVVTRCDPDNGAYNAGVKFLRPLGMLAELERLNAALLGEDYEPSRAN